MPAAVGFENEGLGTRIRINRRCHTETVQHLRYDRTVMPGMTLTFVLPWCCDNNHGCLFGGPGKIVHFELRYIPSSAKELKASAGTR